MLRLLIACLAGSALLGAHELTAEHLAFVKISVNTSYDDSASSLARIKDLATYLPPKTEALLPGESVSAFILRVYGVSTYDPHSPSYLPKTYALLQTSILSLNKTTDPTALRAGTILAPQVPKKALEFFNPNLVRNRMPYMMVFDKLRQNLAEIGAATNADNFVNEHSMAIPERETATQSTELYVPLTVALSREVLSDPVLTGDSSVLAFPIKVKLAYLHPPIQSLSTNQDHVVLSDSQHAAIQTLMTTKAVRAVPLFVLDTGWPDTASYSSSRAALRQMLAAVWSSHFSTVGSFPGFTDPSFAAPHNSHVSIVARALAEFEQLDQNQHVQITYIPLTREQGAAGLLTCLLETSYLLQYQLEHSGTPLDDKTVKTAKQNAQFVVNQLPTEWDGEEVDTDKAVLDAILRLGDAWSALRNVGYVVNESWTVQHQQYFVYYSEPPQGIVVAAVGNAEQDINSDEIDFAQRCSSTIDTLAVMNMAQDGTLLCCSSFISKSFATGTTPAFAAGFDGEVSGSGCDQACGTSFAAPRVAWIIAAGEALRTGPYQTSLWGGQVKSRVFAARAMGNSDWSSMWLDPVKYLAAQQ